VGTSRPRPLMWVWVAMRCFFDVDCTSSILIAAAGFCAVCLSLPPEQIWGRSSRARARARLEEGVPGL
jgi:hypothetical protein